MLAEPCRRFGISSCARCDNMVCRRMTKVCSCCACWTRPSLSRPEFQRGAGNPKRKDVGDDVKSDAPSVDLFESEVTDSALEYTQAGDAIARIPVKYQRPKIATLELVPHEWNEFPRRVPVTPQHQASVLDR